MNKVTLLGRLTKDIECRFMKNEKQTAYASFTLAVPKYVNGKEEADFISCKVFGKAAETLEKWTEKGCRICVSGEWTTGSYEKDKKTVYTNECTVRDFSIIDFVKDEEEEKEDRRSSRDNRRSRR